MRYEDFETYQMNGGAMNKDQYGQVTAAAYTEKELDAAKEALMGLESNTGLGPHYARLLSVFPDQKLTWLFAEAVSLKESTKPERIDDDDSEDAFSMLAEVFRAEDRGDAPPGSGIDTFNKIMEGSPE